MASPQDLVDDLQDIPELIAAQVAAGLSHDEVSTQLFAAWAERLSKHVKMQPKGKIAVTNAINSGPWNATQKKELASVLNLSAPAKSASSRRASQKMQHPENYIRTSIMAKLRTPISRANKLSLHATEMRHVGVELADERLLFRLVQIYAWTSDIWDIPQDDILTYMDNVQAYIKSVPRNKNIKYIEHYPATAELLEPELQRIIFADGNVPVPMQVPELDNILAGNKMRGRKAKKSKSPAWVDGVPEEHRAAVLSVINKKASSSTSTSAPDVPQTPAPSPHDTVFTQGAFRFSARQHVKPEVAAKKEPAGTALVAAEDDDNDDDDSDDEDEDGTKNHASLEDVDALTANLLAARTKLRATAPKKRPAASIKRPASATMKAPPKITTAKAPPKIKRPASCSKIKIDPKNIGTWKNIHSSIYARKRREVWNRTGDDEAAKAAASAACARAKVAFEKGKLKLP